MRIVLTLGSILFSLSSAPLALAAELPSEPTAQHAHRLDQETAKIRRHHFSRLDDHLQLDAEHLRQSCKYESEISTPPPGKRVVLSFDDGPDPVQTDYILDILNKYEISGTFFLIGEKAKAHPELVSKILMSGHHTIGNHSWDHPNFHEISVQAQSEEILRYEAEPSVGPIKRLFRYPYGNSSCEANALLHDRQYRIIGWHVDSCDWAFDKTGSIDSKEALSCGVLFQNKSNYVEHVVSTVRAHNGGIVLMHEIHPNTLKKLEDIIIRLKQEGFMFSSIEEPDFESSLR